MARVFSLGGDGLTIANAAATLVFFNPPAAPKPETRVIRMWVSQSGSTTSAQGRLQAVTQVSTFPTLVSATPRCLNFSDATASQYTGNTTGAVGTCGINASAEGAGAKTALFGDAFNVLNGWAWVSTPPEQIDMPAGSASSFALWTPAALPTLGNFAVGCNFQEGNA